MTLFEHVGTRLRELREQYNSGAGLSQQQLADSLTVAPNTISRWETATYHPTLEDLDRIARFFGVSVLTFFPNEEPRKDERLAALLRAARQLKDEDLEELRRYAEFRKARSLYAKGKHGSTRKGKSEP